MSFRFSLAALSRIGARLWVGAIEQCKQDRFCIPDHGFFGADGIGNYAADPTTTWNLGKLSRTRAAGGRTRGGWNGAYLAADFGGLRWRRSTPLERSPCRWQCWFCFPWLIQNPEAFRDAGLWIYDLSVVVAGLQKVSPGSSALYFYASTNQGEPVGLFANRNIRRSCWRRSSRSFWRWVNALAKSAARSISGLGGS